MSERVSEGLFALGISLVDPSVWIDTATVDIHTRILLKFQQDVLDQQRAV